MLNLLEIGDIKEIQPDEVLLLGGGLIGTKLGKDFDVTPYDIKYGFDVINCDQVYEVVLSHPRSRIVINATGVTSVDGIESDPELEKKALAVNVGGNKNVSTACLALGKHAIFLSSETAFGPGVKGRPILEGDKPPLDMDLGVRSKYGTTKALGELVAHKYFDDGGDGLIVRIEYPSDKNCGYASKIIGFSGLADDIEISPTLMPELASLIAIAYHMGITQQVLHCVGSPTTPYEYGMALRNRKGITGDISKTSFFDLKMNAPRPKHGVLSREKTQYLLGKSLRTWEQQVDYLTRV